MIFWLFRRKKREEGTRERGNSNQILKGQISEETLEEPERKAESTRETTEEEWEPFMDRRFVERRREPRKILEPARLVKIEIPDDGDNTRSFYVSVVDISAHGMKLISDVPLEPELKIPIKFYLEREPEEVNARIAWCKELMPQLYAIGLDLREMTEEQFKRIDGFLEKFAPYEERRAVRFKRPFLVELEYQEDDRTLTRRFFTYATEISTGGMRIINDFKLPEDIPLKFRIFLGKDNVVELKARVVWQNTKSFGVVIGVQFEEADEQVTQKIKEFIFSKPRT